MKEGIGGNSATPLFNFSLDNGAAGSIHPWKGTLTGGTSETTATTVKGKAFDGIYSVTELEVTISTETVIDGDVMCLEYTYDGATVKNIVVQEADFEPFTENDEDPPEVLTTILPIYKIVESDGTLKVEEMSRTNLGLTSACLDGTIIKALRPI